MGLDSTPQRHNGPGHLSIGLGTQLQVQIDGVEVRMRSTLMGMEAGLFLLIPVPKVAGIGSKIYIGNRVKVAYLCGGTVYAFMSTITNHVKSPANLLFLSYPDEFEHRDLRQHQRIECYLPAVVRIGGNELKAGILDISSSGCRCVMVEKSASGPGVDGVQVGDRIDLSFELLGAKDVHDIPGEVRNITQEPGKRSLGIRFDESNSSLLDKVEEYVKNVQEFLTAEV